MSYNVRVLAARSCFDVVDQGMSLSEVLPKAQALLDNPLDKALLQEICFGVMRYLPQLEAVCGQLMSKPLIKQLRPLQFLLYVGIYQLKFMRIPDHAAISETVDAARELKGQSLTKLINGVLRNVQRQPELFNFATAPAAVQFNHPGWLISALQQAYPQQWQQILDANQQKAPLWLRVNVSKINPTDYAAALTRQNIEYTRPVAALPAAIKLAQAQDVTTLPGYAEGWFSVQDAAAQYAATLLDVNSNQHILDACCAPGGKTCHILELAPGAVVDELALCDEFGLSRPPVRELMRQMAAEGYIDLEANRAARVTSMSYQSLRSFFLAAPLIYIATTQLAAVHSTPSEIDELKRIQALFRSQLQPVLGDTPLGF